MTMMWSTKQLGKALNLSPQRVGQLVKGGVLPHPSRQGHDPFVSIPAYIAFLMKRLTGSNLQAARTAKIQIDTAIRQLELRQLEGSLIETALVKQTVFTLFRETRDQVLTWPSRLGATLAHLSPEQVAHKLDPEVHDLLERLSDALSHEPTQVRRR